MLPLLNQTAGGYPNPQSKFYRQPHIMPLMKAVFYPCEVQPTEARTCLYDLMTNALLQCISAASHYSTPHTYRVPG